MNTKYENKNEKKLLTSNLQFFKKFPEVVSIMSIRRDGNMKIDYDFRNKKSANQNRLKFFRKYNIPPGKVHSALLIHGKKVKIVRHNSPLFLDNADALVTKEKKIFLSVTVADCYPVLFYEPENKLIGLVHAGRKGIVDGIIADTISAMKKIGAEIKNIKIAIGPGISQKNYGFPKDFARKNFKAYFTKRYFKTGKDGKVYADLLLMIKDQLKKAGINPKNLEISGQCTYSHSQKYFSVRWDKKLSVDAMIVLIGLK